LAILGGYAYFARNDPQALQSEDYRLKRQAIDRLADDRATEVDDPLDKLERLNQMIDNELPRQSLGSPGRNNPP